MSIINEGLDYHDMKGQVKPILTVDEYTAKMGKDSDIVTLAFTVNSRLAGQDLVSWLEMGYDFVLDASVSDGEIEPGKYLVFVETNRRNAVPERICEIIKDLQTLTDLDLKDWTIVVNDEEYDADIEVLKQVITLSPHQYRENKESEKELNEYREIAGLNNKNIYENIDEEIKKFIRLANI